ncbi:alpha/beta hydrolase family protein [Streptomyces sp. NC-S4]
MSVPHDRAPGPGVVLLAGRGTTVLRFDKATYAHRDAAAAANLTMTQEYVPHAVEAVGLLRSHRSVDPGRVFVLGHSMGGKVAPAVAAPSVAGLVIMADDTQPMHHAAVRVAGRLATVLPDQVPPAVVETFRRQAAEPRQYRRMFLNPRLTRGDARTERTVGERGVPTPFHSQVITHRGACGKAPLVPQNRSSKPGPAKTGDPHSACAVVG